MVSFPFLLHKNVLLVLFLAVPHTHIKKNVTHELIMASGIARGRVRTTTATQSRKMAAILQIIG